MVVEVENLSKRYGSAEAVGGVSFQIEEGKLFSLLGPNGACKSTTIGMLCGLIEPTGEDARVCGISVRSRSPRLKRVCGYVPQEIALYEELSVVDNLRFWGRLYGLRGTGLTGRIGEVLRPRWALRIAGRAW